MKKLFENEIEHSFGGWSDERLFEISLNSISGCKIKVGDKFYSLWKEGGRVIFKEIFIDFELTEDEFKNVLK